MEFRFHVRSRFFDCLFLRVLANRPQRELQLILLRQRPGIDSAIPQVAREFRRESVQREHAFRFHQLYVANQIVVISVIRERKGRVDLVAIDRVRIDRPATNHRDAFARNFLKHARSIRARRADENFAGNIVGVVAQVFAKRLAELFVDARHPMDGAVQHRSQSGIGY